MVAILTTKKTKPIVVNHVIISSLVRRNFAADLFAENMTIEVNRKAIKFNRTQSNFPKFSIFDWHWIDSINRISIVRLRSIVFD